MLRCGRSIILQIPTFCELRYEMRLKYIVVLIMLFSIAILTVFVIFQFVTIEKDMNCKAFVCFAYIPY